jgi:DNA-binding YbaB/EbfC family protein
MQSAVVSARLFRQAEIGSAEWSVGLSAINVARRTSTMGMANLQRMAMQMQQGIARVKEELADARVEGTAGGGVVKAVVTGDNKLVEVVIDPSAVDPEDVEMLQDLIVAAVNEALQSASQLAETKMAAVTGGLRLPGM